MPHRTLSRLLVVALLAALVHLGGASAAAAAPAVPTALAPTGTAVSGQPVLSWKRVAGAARYEVQLSADSGFSSLSYSVSTTNRRATPTTNLPGGELFWRVRGVGATGTRGAWATASFTGSEVAGPALVSPPEGESLQQPDEAALLAWTPVVKATSYTIEIDDDDAFVQPKTYTSKTTSFLFPAPDPAVTYSWHVKANFSGGFNTLWSEVGHFTIEPLPAPTLTAPDDSPSTQVTDAALDWEPVPGAVRYEIQVSTDDQFNTIVDSATVYSTRYARPKTLGNDQYWWQVRAVDVNGKKSPWADYYQFQRSWPDQPELIYPADSGSVSNPMYYEWSPVPHASSYELQLSSDPNFSPGQYDSCLTKQTTYTTRFGGDLCHPSPGYLWYWRVRGLDAPGGINGTWSQIHSFTFTPALVTQLSPPDAVSPAVDVPTLTWAPYPQAESYKVTIKKAGGGSVTATTHSTSYTPTGSQRLDSADGPFTWTVQAIGDDGALTQIPLFGGRQFQVTDAVLDDTGVSALTPAAPASLAHSTRFPSLAWEPWFDGEGEPADYYKVYVGVAGTDSYAALTESFPYAAATDLSDDHLKPGTYSWFVVAYQDGAQVAGPGPTRSFVVDDLAAATGHGVSLTGQGFASGEVCQRKLSDTTPVCASLQQTPVLKWQSVPHAAYYMVYLSRDLQLTNLIYNPVTNPKARTSNTMWAPQEQLPDSQAGTAYYWVIRPCKATGVCAPDPTAATHSFDKRSNPISGLEERQHESDTVLGGIVPKFRDEVVLSWDDYLDTNQAGNDVDVTGLPSTVEAKTYKVQISTDKNFPATSATITSPEIDQTSYTVSSRTLPEGTLYWRVQALDGSGNGLAWSLNKDLTGNAREIEKHSPAPALTLPTDDGRVSGNPTFSWQPQAYAAKYTIEVYKNNDSTFSAANRVVSTTVTQPSYAVFDKVLPPSTVPYLWRVRRIDGYNLPGRWSDVHSFTIRGNPPTQVAPGADKYVVNRDGYFTWLPVDGATSYRFEARAKGSTSASGVTTVGLSWAPTTTFADGGYEWRVSAYDAGNNLLGGSAWRGFTVDSSAPRVVKKTPTKTATRSASFVARFSEPVKGVGTTTMALSVEGQQHRLSAAVKTSDGAKTATLDPARNLRSGKSYTVTLFSSITDRAGNPLRKTGWTVTAR